MRSPRRMMCASVLGFECIVLGLSAVVLISVVHVSVLLGLVVGLGLAIASAAIAGMLRFEWAYYLGFVLQASALALGFEVAVMFVLGVVFGGLYTTAYVLGRKIEREQAQHMIQHQPL